MVFFPGTVKEATTINGEAFLDGLFVGGNIMMSQLNEITGLNAPSLQNWIMRGFISRPIGKKYSENQVARILIVNMVRKTLMLEDIPKLLYYINGEMDDASDDIIGEKSLYGIICRVLLCDDFTLKRLGGIIERETAGYEERFSGARERLQNALTVICKAYVASRLIDESEKLIGELEI